MKILITGANGQLGKEITRYYSNKGHELLLEDSKSLDITNMKLVYDYFNNKKPDIVINCAAYTKVDKCEEEIDISYKVNVIGAKNLAIASYNIGCEIVHISTDYVFDGNGNKPLTEFDLCNPKTIYGKTKLYGETMIKEFNPKHYIIRTAWLYGDGNNFVNTMLNLAKTHKTLKVVNDQIGTPTSTIELAKIIANLIKNKNYGLFHCTCKGECSWYEFANEIFKLNNINIEVIPCTTDEFPRPAKRPKYSVLRNYMLELTTGDIVKHWKEALKDYFIQQDGVRN